MTNDHAGDGGASPFTVSVPPREYEVEEDPAGRTCSLTGDYWVQEEPPAFR